MIRIWQHVCYVRMQTCLAIQFVNVVSWCVGGGVANVGVVTGVISAIRKQLTL